MKTALRLASLGFLIIALTAVAHANVTETFKQTYPLAADGVVQLENVNGSVEITAWDRPEVSLEAEKSAPDADYLARIHLVINATPSRLSIKTEYEKKWSLSGDTRGEVHYQLMVPAGVSLKTVDVVNSEIKVRNVKGTVDLHSVNGGIQASGLAATGRFATVNGPIDVRYARLDTVEKVALDTVNGSCRLVIPEKSGFQLSADSVNGGISCDLPVTLEKSGRRHLRGTVGTGGPQVSLKSVNGGLSIQAK